MKNKLFIVLVVIGVGALLLYILTANKHQADNGLLPSLPSKDSFQCKTGECVYYHVDSPLYAIKQPTENSCWATTLTMIISWKEKKSLPIANVMKRFGPKYVQLFDQSKTIGIELKDELELYKTAGIEVERQLNPSIEGWSDYLKEFGPLAVTIDARPPYGGTVHSILVTGIFGRKDAKKTSISFIDPKTGKEQLMDFMAFIKMYEAKYSVDWQIQIIHLPKQTS